MTASSVPASKPAIAAATRNSAPVLEVSTLYKDYMYYDCKFLFSGRQAVVRQLLGRQQADVIQLSGSCQV